LRGWVAIALVAAWGLRLSGHLALRNWNAPEDRRYRAMRERNDPGFAWKSLYLVFGLQAVLAWVISAPLSPAIRAAEPLGILDVAGATLAAFGIAYEAIADRQLARFLAESGNSGGVMDRGLWRYSRHPNYFGECCTWWGLYLLAAGAGGAWTVFAPLLITFLLLRVSGVSLLEKDIGERRPAYRNYVRRRFNRDAVHETPARHLELVPRQLRGGEVLAWRQDWGKRSIHPLSYQADRTVAERIPLFA